MRCQDREVDRADEAFASEFCRAQSKIVRPYRVMCHVTEQEQRRNAARGQHAESMSMDAPLENEHKAGQQKQAAQAVERGVQVRKDVEKVHSR